MPIVKVRAAIKREGNTINIARKRIPTPLLRQDKESLKCIIYTFVGSVINLHRIVAFLRADMKRMKLNSE